MSVFVYPLHGQADASTCYASIYYNYNVLQILIIPNLDLFWSNEVFVLTCHTTCRQRIDCTTYLCAELDQNQHVSVVRVINITVLGDNLLNLQITRFVFSIICLFHSQNILIRFESYLRKMQQNNKYWRDVQYVTAINIQTSQLNSVFYEFILSSDLY